MSPLHVCATHEDFLFQEEKVPFFCIQSSPRKSQSIFCSKAKSHSEATRKISWMNVIHNFVITPSVSSKRFFSPYIFFLLLFCTFRFFPRIFGKNQGNVEISVISDLFCRVTNQFYAGGDKKLSGLRPLNFCTHSSMYDFVFMKVCIGKRIHSSSDVSKDCSVLKSWYHYTWKFQSLEYRMLATTCMILCSDKTKIINTKVIFIHNYIR